MSIEQYQHEIEWRGPVLRQRRGVGILTPTPLPPTVSGPIECEFEVFLFQNGDLYAYGKATDDGTHDNPTNLMLLADTIGGGTHYEFKGQAEGFNIELKDLLLTGVHTAGGRGQTAETAFRLCVTHVEESKPNFEGDLCELKFYLTNLELPPLPSVEVSLTEEQNREGQILELNLGNCVVWIEPLQGDKKRFERLAVTKGCEVTATASVVCASSEVQVVKEQIVLLCQLLTFIQGTRINWLAYDLLSVGQEPVVYASWWQNAVTRPFGGATLINRLIASSVMMHVGKQTYVRWIESTFPRFVDADKKWIHSALINSYLDAADGSDFLELKGLKICGCMEILRDRYLEMENKVHQIDPSAWTNAVPTLKARTLPILKDLLPDETEEILSRLTNHFTGMNYYAFRRALTELCQQIGYAAQGSNKKTKEAIGAFLSIRNDLVHRGRFAVPLEPLSGWTQQQIDEVRWAQYQFIERFCGGILASLIGWNEAQSLEKIKVYMPPAPRVWEGE